MRAVTAEQKRQIPSSSQRTFPNYGQRRQRRIETAKRILRLLVRDITVTKGPEPKSVKLQVRWQGGAATETLELRLPSEPRRSSSLPRRLRSPHPRIGDHPS